MVNFKKLRAWLGLAAVMLPSAAHATEYKVGQVWSYHNRPGEESSRLIIVNITERKSRDVVYNIYIDKVKLRNPHVKGGIQDHLPHAPVTKSVLDQSVVELVEIRKELPDFENAFREWKEPFDAGEAGVFTVSVAEILRIVEKAVDEAS